MEKFNEGLDVLISLLEWTNQKQKVADNLSKSAKDHSPVKANVATSKSPDTCMFCSEEHRSSQCPTYVSPKARITVLFKENICLSVVVKDIRLTVAKQRLTVIVVRAHTTHCCVKSRNRNLTNLIPVQNLRKTKHQNPHPPPPPTHTPKSHTTKQSAKPPVDNSVATSSITTQTSACGGGIALSTAMLRLKTRAASNEVNTLRCFFDSGSQKSFIHPEVLKNP